MESFTVSWYANFVKTRYNKSRRKLIPQIQGNARTTVLLVVAKENNIDIELVETRPPNTNTEYLKLNPLNRVPTFVGSGGFILTEAIAIAVYCMYLLCGDSSSFSYEG